jgi:hypothetical protein
MCTNLDDPNIRGEIPHDLPLQSDHGHVQKHLHHINIFMNTNYSILNLLSKVRQTGRQDYDFIYYFNKIDLG